MKKIDKQIEEYLNYCENIRRLSKQTLRNKRWAFKWLLDSAKINDISQLSNDDLSKWIMEQTARGCSGRTINVRISNILTAVSYFKDTGVTFTNLNTTLVLKAKEMPPKRSYYTSEQIKRVLSYADRIEWLLISLCYDCGFRISELQRLRLSNIDGQRITFIGKGSKMREVYMSSETKERLDQWIEAEKITDYLWPTKYTLTPRPITTETCRYLMQKPFHKAGITDFYPHALRHSFATNICNNGAPLPIAQKMLGHSNLATTEHYVHTFDGHLKEYFNEYKFAVI